MYSRQQSDLLKWSACYGSERGTKVLLSNGQQKNIEELCPGEFLTGEKETGLVSQVREQNASVILEIFCMDCHTICVTGNYLFARIAKETRRREWVTAEDLNIGDWLVTIYDQTSVVAHIEVRKTDSLIYQVFTDEAKEYFSNGFLTLA